MKLICYILLILLIPTIPVGAQTLSGGQVQVSNQSILISDNGQVMIGMDITLPTAMELSSNCVATLTPVLKTQDNSYNRILPAIWVYGRIRSIVQQRERSIPSDAYTILRRKNGTEQTVNYSAHKLHDFDNIAVLNPCIGIIFFADNHFIAFNGNVGQHISFGQQIICNAHAVCLHGFVSVNLNHGKPSCL